MKLVSLNIGGYEFLDRSISWLRSVNADVVCLQEVFEGTLVIIARELGCLCPSFVPQAIVHADRLGPGPEGAWGLAMFARTTIQDTHDWIYSGSPSLIRLEEAWTHSRVLQLGSICVSGEQFRVANIHAPWTADVPTEQQLDCAPLVCDYLQTQRVPTILCGDFNAPQGGDVMQHYYRHGISCLPRSCPSTLDPKLHRLSPLAIAVDDILVPPGYRVTNFELHFGIADHAGLVAEICRAV